jgi:hypothetical protein
MKNEKKQNKQEETPLRDLMEKYLMEEQENHLLRCQSKHVLKLGNVVLEIIPTDKNQNLSETMKEFTKFAKQLQKLHGNAHIKEELVNTTDKGGLGAITAMYE